MNADTIIKKKKLIKKKLKEKKTIQSQIHHRNYHCCRKFRSQIKSMLLAAAPTL